jgi:hypothetical protein
VKKGISISLVFLMVAALFRFSIATHFCGGEAVNTTISLSGNNVSCCVQAENSGDPLHETRYSSLCCSDIITSYALDSIFTTTQIVISKLLQNYSQVFSNPCEMTIHSSVLSETNSTGVRPPGLLMSTSVDLSDICVYRI